MSLPTNKHPWIWIDEYNHVLVSNSENLFDDRGTVEECPELARMAKPITGLQRLAAELYSRDFDAMVDSYLLAKAEREEPRQ